MVVNRDRSLLCIIDIQERLLPAIQGGDAVLAGVRDLVTAARLFDVPVLCSEQYPQGLGPTVPDLRAVLSGEEIHAKTCFSCAGDAGISTAVAAAARPQLILCGVEAHVCVLQSVLGFKAQGYEVLVVRDAVSSREPASASAALDRCTLAGIPTPTREMILFEWMEDAAQPIFKDFRTLVV